MNEIRVLGWGYYGVDTNDITSFSPEVSAVHEAARRDALAVPREKIHVQMTTIATDLAENLGRLNRTK